MEFKDVLKHFGSRNKIARALGLTRQAITRWGSAGIPQLQQYRIEEITDGKLERKRERRKR